MTALLDYGLLVIVLGLAVWIAETYLKIDLRKRLGGLFKRGPPKPGAGPTEPGAKSIEWYEVYFKTVTAERDKWKAHAFNLQKQLDEANEKLSNYFSPEQVKKMLDKPDVTT